MSIVSIKNLIYQYFRRDDKGEVEEIVNAIDDVTLDVEQGDFIAILGHNGSGKSTLAKHINALLKATEGTVYIDGKDCANGDNEWDIRREVGMVFQNPDNQIIGTIVEEDVAFGPENLGVSTEDIWNRVLESLDTVNMAAYSSSSPNKLSGGQKQRVAIAGILAMEPRCIVLDESTAMLDPKGRQTVLDVVNRLNKEKNITIIFITHNMEEVLYANKIYIMNQGRIALCGTPREVFADRDKLLNCGMELPEISKLVYGLIDGGLSISPGTMTVTELGNQLYKYKDKINYKADRVPKVSKAKVAINPKKAIILNEVSYTYSKGTVDEKKALEGINLSFGKGEFVGIVGHTGSGKSTLLQQLNGLLKPESGIIYYNGEDIYDKSFDIFELRKKVGLVFQYPEYQLFAETIFDDVVFGPNNMGLTRLEAQKRAFEAIDQVGLGDAYYDVSPFQLSGGQKRRVAIAGIIAMKPEYLVLDEPTAGLDANGKKEIYTLLKTLNQDNNMTIVVVSHSMEDMAEYVDRIVVMNKGKVKYDDAPEVIFSYGEELEKMELAKPRITYILRDLKKQGYNVSTDIYTVDKALQHILAKVV